MANKFNAALLADAYKVSHFMQYPVGTQRLLMNLTPRFNRYAPKGAEYFVTAFGMQATVQYVTEAWNEGFFDQPWSAVKRELSAILRSAGLDAEMGRWEALHRYGRLPIRWAWVQEGSRVRYGTPVMTWWNSVPEFFWVAPYLETVVSATLWPIMTVATTAYTMRQRLNVYLTEIAGQQKSDGDFVLHDFSMRGMSSVEHAAMAGMGHLLVSRGTDTIPALQAVEKYYDSDVEEGMVGCSVPATEHSAMCARIATMGELESLRDLITRVYPTGIVSVVQDTVDYFASFDHIEALREEILARDGCLVIRADSGDQEEIIFGTGEVVAPTDDIREQTRKLGTLWRLGTIFDHRLVGDGYAALNTKVGFIYGDGMSPTKIDAIQRRLLSEGYSPTTMVFGVGSFAYNFATRDTLGIAVKATSMVADCVDVPLQKAVATDSSKRSHRGGVDAIEEVLPVGSTVLRPLDGLTFDEAVARYRTNATGLVMRMDEGVWCKPRATFSEVRARVGLLG